MIFILSRLVDHSFVPASVIPSRVCLQVLMLLLNSAGLCDIVSEWSVQYNTKAYMEQQYICICDARIPTFRQVKAHISKCETYLRRCFFLANLDRFPKQLSNNDLELYRAEIELVGQFIRDKIYRNNHAIKQVEKTEDSPIVLDEAQSKKESEPEETLVDAYKPSDSPDFPQLHPITPTNGVYGQQIIECLSCKNKFYASYEIGSLFYIEECWHMFCKTCIIKHINTLYVEMDGNLKCLHPDCDNIINRDTIRELIGEEKLDLLEKKVVKKVNNIISCFKCEAEFFFEAGKPEALKDGFGKPLTKEMEKHYADNRFNCYNCKAEQCKKCRASPYHIGKTCEQFKLHQQSLKCRYCLEMMPESNHSTGILAFQDICNKKQCQEEVKRACAKVLECGHPCRGVANQKHCLPCIAQGCSQHNPALMGQTGEDYCAICYIEALDSSPCVRSICGHIFHNKCLQKRFEIRWIGPRILFNFCMCPLCKKWIQLPEDNPLVSKVSDNYRIYEKIKSKCAERLKFEGCEKDDKLINPSSPFYDKPTEYALAIFAYYQCYKCKEPYFGGRKACQNAMQENQGEFNQKQLVCSNCCEIPVEDCPKHGKQHIEFKCRFCCSVAQWFCWGNTHFCESCHQKQCKGEYVSKYTKDKLPKCEGPGKCPVGGNHQGNGDEKPLGCALCRNLKQSNKDF